MTTAFITRMHYEDDELFQWRYWYYRTFTLPSIQKQSPPFDIWVWCEPKHSELFTQLGVKVFHVPNWEEMQTGHQSERRHGMHIDFVPFSAVQGMPRYDLQISIDSDDVLMRPDFLGAMSHFLKPGERTHVSFNWRFFDASSLRFFKCPHKYGVNNGTAIFALWQPRDADNYVFACSDSHNRIGQKMDNRKFVADDSYCAVSIHPFNDSTRITKRIPCE